MTENYNADEEALKYTDGELLDMRQWLETEAGISTKFLPGSAIPNLCVTVLNYAREQEIANMLAQQDFTTKAQFHPSTEQLSQMESPEGIEELHAKAFVDDIRVNLAEAAVSIFEPCKNDYPESVWLEIVNSRDSATNEVFMASRSFWDTRPTLKP